MQEKTYQFQLPKQRLEHIIDKKSFEALLKAKQILKEKSSNDDMSPSQSVADSNTIQ